MPSTIVFICCIVLSWWLIAAGIVRFLDYFSLTKYYTFQYSLLYAILRWPVISRAVQYFYSTVFSSILSISWVSHIFYHSSPFLFDISIWLLLFMIGITLLPFLSFIRWLYVRYRNTFRSIAVCFWGSSFIVLVVQLFSIITLAIHYASYGAMHAYFLIIHVIFIFLISSLGITIWVLWVISLWRHWFFPVVLCCGLNWFYPSRYDWY